MTEKMKKKDMVTSKEEHKEGYWWDILDNLCIHVLIT